jgi:hypothetical protein
MVLPILAYFTCFEASSSHWILAFGGLLAIDVMLAISLVH